MNYSLIYSNVHNPMFIKKPLYEKTKVENKNIKPISVLFVVIDSVSRLNLIRTMPKTHKYLLQSGFYEMKGYNKIDDNTFPNFNALLTGFNLKQSREICQPDKIGMLDVCPMIWYDYKNLGYVTAYAEDHTSISTYNYFKRGFSNPPTDYYFKPYFEASEYLGTRMQDYMPFCAGPESAGERVLNLANDFSKTYLNVPKFGIFWMNTFSHNHINSPTRMDEKLLEFFQDLKLNGVFDDSIVIFLSDHGIRFGEVRQTTTGWFEERLPMNLISLPKWFKQKYPEETANLEKNQHKLTTTFDVYQTLQHLLVLSGKNYTETSCQGAPSCTSLLKHISTSRHCQDAGIPDEWCSCTGYFSQIATDSSIVINGALGIIDKHLKHTYYDNYTLDVVKKATLSENFKGNEYLLVTSQTKPFAVFNSLLRFTNSTLNLIQMLKVA
ncbi:unnamed protein product [Brassicogethes aeneus]|uniref:Uncharacterized protein n=1 Tax=Brassicogethes aeneus TaxID=1431903 RepID=A0A9P0FQJ1_BRAAE|nr:unnamed protein product [Brassicogethes aeneus]